MSLWRTAVIEQAAINGGQPPGLYAFSEAFGVLDERVGAIA